MSASNLLSGVLISCLGGGLFMYGKNAQRMVPLLAGLAMCVYPFFFSVMVMWAVTAALLVALYMLRGT